MERIANATEEEREKAMQELFAPLDGTDPDRVTQDVVDEEMSLFHSLARQTRPGGM